MWVQHPFDSHPFHSMSIGPPIPEIQYFQNLTLKIKGQGQMNTMLHNYWSRQFHRTSNGTDPSRGFRDMGSAKSGPSAAWFYKFLAHGQAHMGQITMTVHNYRSRLVHETLNGVNPSSWFYKFLAHGQAYMGQMGKWPWLCTTTGQQFHHFEWRKSIKWLQRYEFRKFGSQPPAWTVTTIPLQPGGLRGKNCSRSWGKLCWT